MNELDTLLSKLDPSPYRFYESNGNMSFHNTSNDTYMVYLIYINPINNQQVFRYGFELNSIGQFVTEKSLKDIKRKFAKYISKEMKKPSIINTKED